MISKKAILLLLGMATVGADVEIINLTSELAPGSADVLVLQKAAGGAGSTRKVTVNNLTGSFITAASTDTLTNKTMDDLSNFIHSNGVHLPIRNSSGVDMDYGDVVYISGYNIGQDLPEVELADADDVGTFPVIGMLTEDIGNNANGSCLISGQIEGLGPSGPINTISFAAKDPVYMSTTPGGFSVKPVAAIDEVQKIGIVLRSHVNMGVIELVGAGRENDIPNKMSDSIFRIHDNVDSTKLVVFQASGLTTATTRTITMPDNDITLGDVAAHKDTHKSGGADAFITTDLLEAIVKRLQVTGPVTLTMGAVADGEALVRSGASIVGSSSFVKMETGTYSGDGTTSNVVSLSNSTITPDYVKVWENESVDGNSVQVVYSTGSYVGVGTGMAVNSTNGQAKEDKIIAMAAGSFTVDDNGSDEHPNMNGQSYQYLVIGK